MWDFLNILFKRGRMILVFFLSVVVLVTVASLLMTPVYQANSVLLVERELDSEKALLFQIKDNTGYERYNWIQSEIEIIQSHPVAVQLVESFGLDTLDRDEVWSTESEKAERFDKAVKSLKKRLKVESGTESNVITVSYEDEDPQFAMAVVEKAIEFYLDRRSKITSESKAYEFFEEQMQIADENLRELERHQTEYKQSEGVISPEAQKEILLARLADYEKSLTEIRTRRISKEAGLRVIKTHLKDGSAKSIPVTESSDSPSRERHIAKLKGDLLDLELQHESLLQKYTPQYEEVVHLQNQIDVTRGMIEKEIAEIINMEEVGIRALKAEEEVLMASIENTKREVEDFAKKEYDLLQLSRGIEENQEVYTMFSRQREEARISLAKHERGVKVSVISPAYVLPDPVKPKKTLNVVLSVIIGLIGGLGIAFFVEYFDHSISSPTELEKQTGMNVLGSIREFDIEEGTIPELELTRMVFPHVQDQRYHHDVTAEHNLRGKADEHEVTSKDF
jgi:uncharacterized protein involved in exopolysaccharide biosynthesis